MQFGFRLQTSLSRAKARNYSIFEFSEVDFSGVLTSEEVMDIEKMLEEEKRKKELDLSK